MAKQMELARQQASSAEVLSTIETPTAEPESPLITQQESVTSNIQETEAMSGSPEEQDAFKQLADYLTKSISEKKKASAVVGELRMASMMGMFSKESMDQVLNRDFDELVSIMSEIHGNLKTPKARTYMRAIVDGLKG